MRFKRTLKWARLAVRQLTHTLHLPPAQSEIYDGPHPEWLRDVLEKLPNLQSLVVSRLPFFDHLSLLMLQHSSDGLRPSTDGSSSQFPLRLLIATKCLNTTSPSLAEALSHFPSLVVLDLSNTLAARERNVLSSLRDMPQLQIVKLRNVHLRDEDVEILAEALGIRVRSLDVRGNNLTDHSVRTLLSFCFNPGHDLTSPLRYHQHASPNLSADDWPDGMPRPDPALLDEFRDESYDQRTIKRLTHGLVSRLPFEDLPRSGITHLYIANNHLTIEGLASLIKSAKLHVLDIGALDMAKALARPRSFSASSLSYGNGQLVQLPGIEKITPVLRDRGEQLTSLRIHHAVVTEIVPLSDETSLPSISELSVDATQPVSELHHDSACHELDASEPVFELSPDEATPRYELPGDPLQIVISPAIGEQPGDDEEKAPPYVKGDGAFAPEVNWGENDDDSTLVLTATGLGSMAQGVNGVGAGSQQPDVKGSDSYHEVIPHPPAAKTFEDHRKDLQCQELQQPHGLVPSMLPKLRIFRLTDVPNQESDGQVVKLLINFIRNCAAQARLAKLEDIAKLAPQRQSGLAHWHHKKYEHSKSFALERIELEMEAPNRSNTSTLPPQTTHFTHRTKSSTEDPDSEAFWKASENDFSFFDDEEECGLPAAETTIHFPMSTLSEKMVQPPEYTQEDTAMPKPQKRQDLNRGVDVVQELARFRRERKTAYEEAIKRGETFVEGHWPGDVKVVRWPARRNHDF